MYYFTGISGKNNIMKKIIFISNLMLMTIFGCQHFLAQTVISLDKSIKVTFGVNAKKHPYYFITKDNKLVIDSSEIGIMREDADFFNNMILLKSTSKTVEDHYQMLHGKKRNIHYKANQRIFSLKNKDGLLLDVVFNVSNDGVAFRYQFPEISKEKKIIKEEISTFKFNQSSKAWLQPMSKAKTGWSDTNPSYEEYYLSNISLDTKSPIGEGWVFPALIKTNDYWVSLSETDLGKNYCASHLNFDEKFDALRLVFPQKEEIFTNGALLPEAITPWETPWRIIAIGNLKQIYASTLGTDLAKPQVSNQTEFVKPGISSWSWGLLKDDSVNYETSKEFIEYASKMHWPYCLIDADWDRRIGWDKIKELIIYAKQRNVKLILWYNSAGDWNKTPYTPKNKFLTKESREEEFKKLHEEGIAGVKVDFFGGDGQSMISYYQDILETALKYKILVNFHGATIPRGWQRTYPNLLTVEAIKGLEFITFEQINANEEPHHATIIPFTRNLYDPMDFTPMVLDSIPNINRVTSKSFELALPTIFNSGIQHLVETPQGMAKMPEYVINYLKDIPVSWDESKLLMGFPGKEVIVAKRRGKNWFISGINGENIAKQFEIDLSFINKKGYIIEDDGNKSFKTKSIDSRKIKVKIEPYGGFVMKF